MNERQVELWNNLMSLVETNEAFYYGDREINGRWFRIFNYRLASYTDFLLPDALECRGHMFEITKEGKDAAPVHLSSWTLPKFFNYRENPFTMDLNLSEVVEIATKLDGSLISTYLCDGLRLKTKGSLDSDQAIDALKWLNRSENSLFKDEVLRAESEGYTVNMEWLSPNNRIVIGYEKPELRVLALRNRKTGEFMFFEQAVLAYNELTSRWTDIKSVSNPVEFVAHVPDMKGVEGFVCRMKDGQLFKLKCDQYIALHHTKDSINSPRRLFEAVLEEATDDMKSMFYDDPVAMKMITEMETFVEEKYNHMVDSVERFYQRNKHLDRKEYAILGQQELDRMYFGLAMNRYTGKSVDYKAFLKRQWKKLGLKDDVKSEDE